MSCEKREFYPSLISFYYILRDYLAYLIHKLHKVECYYMIVEQMPKLSIKWPLIVQLFFSLCYCLVFNVSSECVYVKYIYMPQIGIIEIKLISHIRKNKSFFLPCTNLIYTNVNDVWSMDNLYIYHPTP